jgi:hypothetical protein
MFAANTYDIHLATEEDDPSLSRLAKLDSGCSLQGPALVGHIDGEPSAAISLADHRIVADPLRRTDHLVACLRVRADALRAYEEAPSLRTRMLAALSAADRAGPPALSQRTAKRESAGRTRKRPARRQPLAVG